MMRVAASSLLALAVVVVLDVAPRGADALARFAVGAKKKKKTQQSFPVPHFTVDLDIAPEDRWKDVVRYYVESGLAEAKSATTPQDDASTEKKMREFVKAARPHFDEEVLREMDGYAKYALELQPSLRHMTVDDFIANEIGYEMNYPTFCSGLLAAMPNGTVVHGRNMDYTLDIQWKGKSIGWPELTIDVTFMRGGKPLFTSVTWPGQFGIHTAIRHNGGWTFEQNTRRTGDDFQANLEAMQAGGTPFSIKARRIMETVPDFETAVEELWSANFAATQYFIMTGAKPWEAAVLAMDRGGVHHPGSPPLQRLSSGKDGGIPEWRLLQTNDDTNKIPLDGRRPMEELKLLGTAPADVSPEWVYHQMLDFPLHNWATVFTWLAVPALDYYQTTIPRNRMVE